MLRDGRAFFYHQRFDYLPVTAIDSIIDETDSNITLTIATDVLGGAYVLTLGTNAENELFWTGLAPVCNINGGNGKMVFEACIEVSSVVDDVLAVVCGLIGVVAAGEGRIQINASGKLTAGGLNFVGYQTKHYNAGTTGQNALLMAVHKV
ncbi:hypothetical protein LCGC14_2138860, partial [marine sediment metagenome]